MLVKLLNDFIRHQKAQVSKHWRSSTIIFKMNSTNTDAIDLNIFTPEEKDKILNIINYQDMEDLSQYSITKKHAQHLALHRANNGPYHLLEDLLQLEDMNDKSLYKFYKSIISGKKKKTSRKVIPGLVITPKVTNDKQKNVNTVLGIHVGVDMISWSLLNRDCEVLQWNYKFFRNRAKDDMHSLLQTTLSIATNLPEAERYIMQESDANNILRNPMAYQTCMEHYVINAVILSHLATLHSRFDPIKFITNNIFIFRKNILRKVYGLVIGNENMSTQYVLQKLLEENEEPLENKELFPTVYINPEFQNMYNTQSPINKEQISWSLLIAFAFVELIVHERTDLRIRNLP